LRSRRNEPVYFARTGNELSLSGAAVAKLLKLVIERGKPFKFKARGWSMSPFIKNGDILTLSPLSTAFPQKGDVVGVIDPGTEKLLVHRVVGMNNGRYWIKGDSAGRKEARSFELNSICGQVTRVELKGMGSPFGSAWDPRSVLLRFYRFFLL